MTSIPTPSAWRYEHKNKSGGTLYIYSTRLEPADGPDYVQMYTSGQLNQYGQACFDEGVSSVHTLEPMTEADHGITATPPQGTQ